MNILNLLGLGRKLSPKYTIDIVFGMQFPFNGGNAFLITALPLGGKSSEPFILPYNQMWNDIAMHSNNRIVWIPESRDYVWTKVTIPELEKSSFNFKSVWLHKSLL